MTAIPFDIVFKFDAAQLKSSYLVNLRDFSKPGRGMEEEELPAVAVEASESEAEAEADDEKIGNADAAEDAEAKEPGDEGKKKKKKARGRQRKEVEYDLDDPFIDDSDMNEVYRSVFDLMGEAPEFIESDNGEMPANEQENGAAKQSKSQKTPNFFVYRGPLSNEILAK